MIMFFVATNNTEFPYVKILGQKLYNNNSDARDDIGTAWNDMVLEGLPSPEFLPIGAVIVDSDGECKELADGSLYVDLRATSLSGSGTQSIPVSAHNDLTNRDVADAHPSNSITYDGTTVEAKLDELTTKTDVINPVVASIIFGG
jgi:hypothetical protein